MSVTVELTNLLPGGFEDLSDWTATHAAIDSTHVHSGSSALKLTGATGYQICRVDTVGTIAIDATHLYYLRIWVWYRGVAVNPNCSCYVGIAEPYMAMWRPLASNGVWTRYSIVNGRDGFDGAQKVRFNFNNRFTTDCAWYDDAMLIDLTETFGAGNEPTATWCDANIPDFQGTYSLTLRTVTIHDQGVETVEYAIDGATVDLPTSGTDSTRTLEGWTDGSTTVTGTWTVDGDATLLARYRNIATEVKVDSVSCQPNPVTTGSTVLLTVNAVLVDREVGEWPEVALSASQALPMASPAQLAQWDTTDSTAATFEADGIPTVGMVVPPLSSIADPLPRIGVWSAGISDADGSVAVTITGTLPSAVTCGIVMRSSPDAPVTEATVTYSDGTVADAVIDASTAIFPSATYTSFTISITRIGTAYRHARILEISPGGV